MTPATIATGWLLVGIAISAAGVAVIWVVSSDLFARRAVRKAEQVVAETPEQRERRLWNAEIDQALQIAGVHAQMHAHMDERLTSVADVVPIQRGAVD